MDKKQHSDLDTKERIMGAVMQLFASKGYDGVTIREIAKLANVNVASLNYHFKSKENLRAELMEQIVLTFKEKIKNIPKVKSTAEYAIKIYEIMILDRAQCVNQFKLILEADHHPCEADPFPVGFEEFSRYLAEELNAKVPTSEKMWLVHMVFSYIVHISVMSSSNAGTRMIEKFFPKKKDSIPVYIEQLVNSLIRDLNQRY